MFDYPPELLLPPTDVVDLASRYGHTTYAVLGWWSTLAEDERRDFCGDHPDAYAIGKLCSLLNNLGLRLCGMPGGELVEICDERLGRDVPEADRLLYWIYR